MPDALLDRSFAAVAAGALPVRLFAGAPLTTADGVRMGVLCLVDAEPHAFGADDLAILEYTGQLVARGRGPEPAPPRRRVLFAVPMLLVPEAFVRLLDIDLGAARAGREVVELATLAPTTPAANVACAAAIHRAAQDPTRLAVGDLGPDRLGVFARGREARAGDAIAAAWQAAREVHAITAVGALSIRPDGPELDSRDALRFAAEAAGRALARGHGQVVRYVLRSDAWVEHAPAPP